MAIKNSLGQIIGVIQLINKFDDLVSLSSCLIAWNFPNDLSLMFFRFSRKTTRTLSKHLQSSVEWEFTIHICMRKRLLRWQSKVSHLKFSAITHQHRPMMPFD